MHVRFITLRCETKRKIAERESNPLEPQLFFIPMGVISLPTPSHSLYLIHSFSFSSFTTNPFSFAQCDLPELIRHCHANSTHGISLMRHAPRDCTCTENLLVFHLALSVSSRLIKLISSCCQSFSRQCYSELGKYRACFIIF